MSGVTSIALVGIGGYGNCFVAALLDNPRAGELRFAGTIDPSPTSCRRFTELAERKIPHYPSLDAFLQADRADLLVLSTPIHLHAWQTCKALEHGSHVVCEKPLCVTVDQARRMRETRDRTGRHVAIGYQWSFAQAIQTLKADIQSGVLGKAKRLRTMVLWPRDEAYYARNRWAGAIADPDGHLVLDSPVNNACAHYLHNMLYVLGGRPESSALPESLTAELYRAHDIQNYDTAAIRCVMPDGVELVFIASHATHEQLGPALVYEFEHATVEFVDRPDATFVARFHDGRTKNYGSPNEPRDMKLWKTIEAIRDGRPSLCGIEAAFPHTQCVQAAQESPIAMFPRDLIQVSGAPGHRNTVVSGLGEILVRCFEEGKLPSQIGADWAKPGRPVQLDPDALSTTATQSSAISEGISAVTSR